MRTYHLFILLLLLSCNIDSKKNDNATSLTDPAKTEYSISFGNNQKANLKRQVAEYLVCTGGKNIDAVSKYIYEGSLKAIINQNPNEIQNQKEAMIYFKSGLIQVSKQVKKLNIKFQYKIGEIDRAIFIKNNSIADFRVVTKLTRDKQNLADTTQFLAISKDNGKTWKFLNKVESKDALSFEFNTSEIESILALDNLSKK